jgi:hypothetical protein
MATVFSQPFCSVVPTKAGGKLVAGPKRFPCLVQVGEGELLIAQGPQAVIDRAPVSAVELVDAPWLQRKVGEGTFLHMNGNHWCIDFGNVPSTELATSGHAIKAAVTAGSPGQLRTARQLNAAFAAALVSEGVIDRRKHASR